MHKRWRFKLQNHHRFWVMRWLGVWVGIMMLTGCFLSHAWMTLPAVAISKMPVAPTSLSIRTWRTPQLITVLDDHKSTVETLAFTPDRRFLASGGGNQDPKIRIWNLRTNKKIHTLRGHQTRVLTLAIAPDGQTLTSGSNDSMLNIWNLHTGTLTHTFMEPTTNILSLAISPNGRVFVSGGLEGLKLWDLPKQRPLRDLLRYEIIYSVAISADGQFLASGDQAGVVRIWDFNRGELLQTLNGHTEPVSAIVFTPDSQTLVSGSYDTTIKLWNVQTGELLNTLLGHPSQVNALAINPKIPVLASAGHDGIRIWDLESRQLMSQFPAHSDWVRSLAFSQDGEWLASGGFDALIKIWQAGLLSPQEVIKYREAWVGNIQS
jgi:WD40 repeat protein